MPLQRLDSYLEATGLDAVWFGRPNNFAWLTGGDNVVNRAEPVGVAAAGYDGTTMTVVTNNIEADRLRAEELDRDIRIETFDWYETDLADAVRDVSPTPAGADFDIPGFEVIDASGLRRPLTNEQIVSYRALGEDAAAAVETVISDLDPSMTEREVATRLRTELEGRGISGSVVLVGGEQRAEAYRHFVPKDEPLGRYALLSVNVNRNGLFASCTRTVAFDPPTWLAERTRKSMRVEATALAATQHVASKGGTAGDVFEFIQDAYAAVGWSKEWQNHHQGGATGFAGREWIATPDSEMPVDLPSAYAWNPTIRGAKSEDTYLVTKDGFELLTGTDAWPMTTVSAVGFDVELPRHGIFHRET
ncbi:M24 family metallopeptidase [Halorhabdus rudnickae]|uniref:M24 family metallopeptidase n=1 Tax=Halorhabdus rudnickae TaxID=1775544 RepID=UPI00108439F4|nr:M24 family metallopeptidase [Halorhabdus rudnickae]